MAKLLLYHCFCKADGLLTAGAGRMRVEVTTARVVITLLKKT